MPLMDHWLLLLRSHRAIAVIRAADLATGQQMAQAAAAGGMRLIEVTWNSDRPATLIAQLRNALPDCWIGAGTLLTEGDVKDAIAAGAQFLFTPHVNPRLIALARNQDTPLVAGALTPTEIVTAWQAGAASVKVFPAQVMGGAAYVRSLQGPLGQIPLVPTGGVTVRNAADFLQAGAIAVGLSSSLFSPGAIQQGHWHTVTAAAQSLQKKIRPFQADTTR